MFAGKVYTLVYHLFVKEAHIPVQHLVTDPNLEIYDLLQFWLYIYYVSKYYELVDTFLLILKNKQLIFLHVWHHAIMLLYTWILVEYKFTYSVCGMIINAFIHVLMYYYYLVASFGGRPWWRRYLTQLQLVQFLAVLTCTTHWLCVCPIYDRDWMHYDWLFGDVSCSRNYTKPWTALSSYAVMLSFVVLFSNFFYQQYLNKQKQT